MATYLYQLPLILQWLKSFLFPHKISQIFKKNDDIVITNNADEHEEGHELYEEGNKIEFKSKNNNKSIELKYAIDRDYYADGFFSSEVVKANNKRSIRYTIRVRDKQKNHMFEYRLRWIVDDKGDFKCWEKPQFLGDIQLYGRVYDVCPFIKEDKVIGLYVNGFRSYFLPNKDDLSFEFKDKS